MATATVCAIQPVAEKNGESASSKDSRYKCKFCGKFYSSSHSLKTHEKWHTGDLKHKCTFCEKKFRNPSEVKRHEMTHTGERPNKCPHCKMKFIQKTSLREHIEKKHQSDSPSPNPSEILSCKYCQKIFEDKESLSVHEENEAKEFEALHESFEQGEFRELENFSLQDYLPQGMAEVNGAFNEQLIKEEQINFTSPASILTESFTILSDRPSNNNDINFEVSLEKGAPHIQAGSQVSSINNSKISENPAVISVKYESEHSSLAKTSSGILNKQTEDSQGPALTKSVTIKEEIFPFSFPENFLSEPVLKLSENKVKDPSLFIKTEVKSFECKLEPMEDMEDIKLEYVDPMSHEHDISSIKEEDKVDEITQFFEELEGQYPHLKTELVDSIQMPLFQSSGEPTALRPCSIKSDSESVKSSDSPRYTGASTPVDTIQASSLTQPSPPSYHSQVLSPLPTSSVPSPEIQSRSVPEMVINSAFLAPTEPIPPVIHIAPLTNTTNQPTVLPSQGLPTSTNNNQFFPIQPQYYPNTHSAQPLSYQDELNVFCEGILNQIESSNWNDININDINNDFQEIRTSSSIVTTPQDQTSQMQTGLPQQQQLTYKTNMLSTTTQNNNVNQHSPNKNSAQILLDSNEKWITDRSSIPNGWRMKIVDTIVGARPIKKSQFLSPSGQFFESRKSALDHMIRTMAYTTEDIETMKKGLRNKTKFEWESGRDGVPTGWKTREKLSSDGKVRIFYLSPGGISFPCRLAAYEHMVKDGAYQQEDIEMMKIGAKSKRNRGKDFTEGDPSVPPGWKIRINAQMKESFRSPSGVFFHSRQTVLDHIVKEGYPQVYIDTVRSKIPIGRKKRRKKTSADVKWIENDPTVPANWKMRIVTCSDGHAVTFFLTPEGFTIKGRKAALQHMIKTGLYDSNDMELMKSHLNVLSRVSDIWIPGDPTLPIGWKIKKYKSKAETNRVHCEYLSPQNHVFRSRKAVIEHMRKVGTYTEDDIRIVESGNVKIKPKSVENAIRKNACWKESDSLPHGWKLKEEGEDGKKRSMFLSPEGKIFWTRFQVLEGMAKSGKYSPEDFAKVQEEMDEFPSNNTKVSKLSTISKPCTLLPNTPSHLPQNFFPANTRENDNQMSISISFTTTNSSNSQTSQAFSQHQTLIVAQRSPAFSALPPTSRDIFSNSSLPASSRVTLQANPSPRNKHQSIPTGPAFINYDSNPGQSQSLPPSQARVTLAGRPTILQAKQEKKAPNTPKPRTSDVGWKTCNSTLPVGWKTRTHFWSDREKHVFLSPEGKIFTSRKSVLACMELAGIYSQEDFDKVRKALHRKRKRKMNSQWVPLKRKSKIKKIKPFANLSFNTNENQNNELVTTRQESVLEPVEDLLKSDDENDCTVKKTNDTSENTKSDETELENKIENIVEDGFINSIKPCVVNLERLQENVEG
eukprot:TRINITY_DN4235_c0_g1_i1.p1 TRINITY_DN4235_c0_g1~~TRINITY_DN4235_c0_g1_i1.p1  ORF type:complete len:1427 (+),score=292.50 TRINITY_DN4235_c0_g1_i1:78-4358(+)